MSDQLKSALREWKSAFDDAGVNDSAVAGKRLMDAEDSLSALLETEYLEVAKTAELAALRLRVQEAEKDAYMRGFVDGQSGTIAVIDAAKETTK